MQPLIKTHLPLWHHCPKRGCAHLATKTSSHNRGIFKFLPFCSAHPSQTSASLLVYSLELTAFFFPPHSLRRQWHPPPVLLPGKSHGRRSLVGCSPWGRQESDMTERLHFHFSLSCIGVGNGNPLQYSCLENSRDGGAWWLPSMGSHRVGHDWSDLAAASSFK